MTSYDRLDWHYDGALAAGQPPEHAFTHIGFYLAWIIRHDLYNREIFPASHVEAVKNGEMTGSDLSDDIDTKLLSLDMDPEGQAFSDARYAAYLSEYAVVFGDRPDYSVVDDLAGYERIAPTIDRLYADWVAAGRPPPPPDEGGPDDWSSSLPDLGTTLEITPEMSEEQIATMLDDLAASGGGVVMAMPTMMDLPHAAPDLEALIPPTLTSPPVEVSSVAASDWGSSLLRRALKQLDVEPRDATVVSGMGGAGESTLTLTLYVVPGAAADRLKAEFDSVVFLPPSGKWSTREVGGRTVRWGVAAEFTVASWVRDGLVVQVAGRSEDVERAVPALP